MKFVELDNGEWINFEEVLSVHYFWDEKRDHYHSYLKLKNGEQKTFINIWALTGLWENDPRSCDVNKVHNIAFHVIEREDFVRYKSIEIEIYHNYPFGTEKEV